MDENKALDSTEERAAEKFGGYTLEDLRYQRALVALKKEFSKSKMIAGAHRVAKRNPINGKQSGFGIGSVGSIAGKLITGMNYLDYVMIGFSLFNTGRKVFSFFHRKKK